MALQINSGGTTGRPYSENILRVFDALRLKPGITRGEVCEMTGLSLSTVGRVVALLRGARVVRTTGAVRPRVGRHAETLAINREYVPVAGLDVGEVWIRGAMADLTGDLLSVVKVPTEPEKGIESIVDRLEALVARLASEAGRRPEVVVVGHTGFVDPQTGRLRAAPHIPGADGFPITQELQRRLSDASVVVDNDVNLAVLGEAWRGAAAGHDPQGLTVLLSFRTGIGAGIVVNGELYRGARGASGEVAYLCGDPEWSLTQSGAVGWTETHAAGPAIVSAYRARKAECDPRSEVTIHHLEALLEAYQQGDPVAAEVLREAMRYYGLVLANIVSVLDPHLVVLGGIVPTLGEDARREIVDVAARMIPWLPPVVLSTLGLEATMYGAVREASRLAVDRLRRMVGQLAPERKGTGNGSDRQAGTPALVPHPDGPTDRPPGPQDPPAAGG